jgi:ABC-type transport system involved in multi-copper enzyme maturation permease subunit
MSGGVAGLAYLLNGVVIQSLGWVLALMWLESLVLLSVSFLGGTRLSTLATGVLAVGLHGLAFFGGWIEEFGAMAGSQTAVLIGQVASVIMPSESLWRRAAYEVQKPIIGGLGTGPFTSGSVPSDLMIVYAAFYMLAALGLAVFLFQQRDL